MQRPFVMGLETEYAVSCRSPSERRSPPQLAAWMAAEVAGEFCSMADADCLAGAYLENGARVYPDIHGHPEYATPECFTPQQVTTYDLAGERILLRLAQCAARKRRAAITVAKANNGAVRPDTITWGNHESYLSWVPLPKAVGYLLPHLVTRLAYAGSGCLSARADGFGFELSQRARHLRRVTGDETTHDRAIFCTRVRKQSDRSDDGWVRAHLIGKDSQRGPLGTFLTLGATGYLFWMLNHGFVPPRELRLAEPVRALRTVSLDPWHQQKLKLTDGRELTALQIQESYVEDCEAFARRGMAPEWGAEVLRHWRSVLSALEKDPLSLAGKLDAYTKLAMFDGALWRDRFTWADVRRGMALVSRLRHEFPEGIVERVLSGSEASAAGDEQAVVAHARSLVEADGPGALERLEFVLRLQVLDLKYHELGGVFDDLRGAGYVENVVVPEADIERAITSPPPGGRAAQRAQLIRAHHGERGWAASWHSVRPAAGGAGVEMSHPFYVAETAVSVS